MTRQLALRRRTRSRETWERVAYLVREHLRLVHAPEMRLSTLKRFLAAEGIEERPTSAPKVSKADRDAARKARRAAATKANKAGELKPQNF